MRSVPVSEPDPFKGVLGPTWAKHRPKTAKTKTKIIVFPRGLTAIELKGHSFRASVGSDLPGDIEPQVVLAPGVLDPIKTLLKINKILFNPPRVSLNPQVVLAPGGLNLIKTLFKLSKPYLTPPKGIIKTFLKLY